MEVTSPESIAAAVAVLRRGGLVGLPTETVYGLAADAENELAVRRIFAVKGRPSTHPLIVHVAHASDHRVLGDAACRRRPTGWPRRSGPGP